MKTRLLLLFTLFYAYSISAQERKIDIEYAPAPLFTCPIFDGAADPSIMWNEERNEWWILYTQRRSNQHFQPGVPYCYGTAIGIAASKNQGRSWYYLGQANFNELPMRHNTYWAPHVFKDKDSYHMIVTFIEGVHNNWGGVATMKHYKSKNMFDWEYVCDIEGAPDCIDASVYKMPDGTWKMWYKNQRGNTATATSTDLKNWKLTGNIEIDELNHEAPIVFEWKGKYWNIIDPCSLSYTGLKIYESDDATNWKFNNNLLNTPGKRRDDNDQGRHADVVIIDDRVFIIYFTHPGRSYDEKNIEIEENTIKYQRSSLQIAELEYIDGIVICNRDKYAK